MSLLPKALQFRDEALSLPLGAAKVKPVAVKVDPIKAFEKGDHKTLDMRANDLFRDWLVAEGRIKEPSTATPPSTEKPPKFKVGDRVQYTKAILTREEFPPTQAQRTVDCVVDYRVHYVEGGWDHVESLELVSPSDPKEADGWVSWSGGDCPIPDAEPGAYMVRFRDGRESEQHLSRPANSYRWLHREELGDIVAYRRLVKQQ